MGMGNYPQYADTVSEKFVKEQCPFEYDSLMDILIEAGIDFDTLCQHIVQEMEVDVEEDKMRTIMFRKQILEEAFKESTGLELSLVYHTSEDQGDELDGGSFAVEGVYQLTSAGKKYEEHIERKFWNNFG